MVRRKVRGERGGTRRAAPPVALALAAVAVAAVTACGTTTTAAPGGTPTTVGSTAATGAPGSTSPGTTAAAGSTGTTASAAASTASGLRLGSWGANVTLTFTDDGVRYVSDGLPNHARAASYALPTGGVRVPDASSAVAGPDPTRAQSYDFTITTNPTFSATTTPAPLGTIGVMISGAAMFNPYEGDGTTVATASNFTVKDAAGNDVAFLDTCNGHPGPMGAYHYHGLPQCITAVVDQTGGPSHLLGLAFDGYPIYGNHAIDGRELHASDLDECNGITSPTPEFPDGIYHYVLLPTADATSSIRCLHGTVDPTLLRPMGPGGGPMGPGGGPMGPGGPGAANGGGGAGAAGGAPMPPTSMAHP